MRRIAIVLCAASCLSCGKAPVLPSAFPDPGPAPAPPEALEVPVAPEYVLKPGDELQITILEEKDSSRKVPVRPDGRISYDFVGDLQAAGRTIAAVRHEIEERLKSLYVSPHVSVIGTSFVRLTTRVYVLGEVTLQRSVTFQQGMSLVAALAEAGGLTPKGKHNQVIVVRGGFDKPAVIAVDYGKVVHGESPDVTLLAGDILYVPPTFLTRLERISAQVIPFLNVVINAEQAEEAARNLGKASP